MGESVLAAALDPNGMFGSELKTVRRCQNCTGFVPWLFGKIRFMSTTNEAIRKLLAAHFKGDDAAFRAAAWDFVEKERSLNHHVLVKELERILSSGNGTGDQKHEVLSTLGALNGNLPRDKERRSLFSL